MRPAESSASTRVRPIILSGGSGTRLWPLSTPARPKQFLSLVGEQSLLHETFARLDDPILFSSPTVICGEAHCAEVRACARNAGVPGVRLIAEPAARNTGAAVALAALTAEHADELLLILPSDHHIERPADFRATVDAARAGADAGLIVTFGMKPTRVDTGFGYVELGPALAGPVRRAERFVEKPDALTAQSMIESGKYLWNGGMFFARSGALIAAFEAHAPDVLSAVRASLREPFETDVAPDLTVFGSVRSVAFDHAVMEKSDNVGVIPSDFGWSDVGTWLATFDNAARDTNGNSVEQGSVVLSGSGNLVRTTGPRIVALGVDGLMMLASDDVVLIAPLTQAQRVREAHAWYHANG